MTRATASTLFLLLSAIVFGPRVAQAQASPTATGPGSFISVGLAASGFQQDYGRRYIGGETLFVDANLYRRIGIEAEGRRLNFHTSEDVKENTYLIGPRLSLNHLPFVRIESLRPYAKLLIGRGTVDFPSHDGTSSAFVLAPAAGLDWHVGESRLNIRILEFEYQVWPRFAYPYGPLIEYAELHPYGLSAGFSINIFTPSDRPRGKHF